jgi:hypothetical protein
MNPTISANAAKVAALLALAGAYFFGATTLMGWFNTLYFPWMPYSGKSQTAVILLEHIPSGLAILVASALAGFLLLLIKPRRFAFGLFIAAPTAVIQLVDTLPVSFKTAGLILFFATFFLFVLIPMLFGPATFCWLTVRLAALRR